MAVREIPAAVIMVCDGCGKEIEQPSKNRPAHWSDLHILRDAYDFQGCAVADASVRRQLCSECSTVVFHAVNTAIRALGKEIGS